MTFARLRRISDKHVFSFGNVNKNIDLVAIFHLNTLNPILGLNPNGPKRSVTGFYVFLAPYMCPKS